MRLIRVRSDERGSLTMAMLVITIGMAMSAMLAPIVIRQFTMTKSLITRNTQLNAAQAGMDVMMARVRAASDEQVGLLEDLPPCTLTGDAGVSSTGETLGFQVTIAYRDQDGNPLTCPLTDVPTTAVVTSVGSAGQAGARTLVATYVFTTSNTNIPGGAIRISASTAGNLCMDSGGVKTPSAGTKVVLLTCNGSSRQQFGYTSDLYLKLVDSEASVSPFGMCLDAGSSHANNNYLTFQPCPSTRTARYQWALDGNSLFRSTNSSGGTEGYCITVQTVGSEGSYVVLGGCSTNASTNVWRSEPGVGAGMAGDNTAQLVNYAQFSRCFDVTGGDPGAKYMIAWFCKQSPNGIVDWNQQWVHPVPTAPAISATDNIVITKSGTKYCLKSPLTATATSYPVVVACSSVDLTTAAMQWTVFHDTGDYGTSYRIQDGKVNCLQPTDLNANPKDVHTDGTSKIRMAPCNSSELQKWNAPANVNKPTPLTDLTEK